MLYFRILGLIIVTLVLLVVTEEEAS